jgi:hypothetical protein
MKQKSFYQQGLETGRNEIRRLKRQLRNLSLLRLSSFILTAAVVYFFWGNTGVLWIAIIVFLILFLSLISSYTRLQRELKLEKAYVSLCESELSFLKGEYSNREEGSEFINKEHPYTSDLNIFGKHSMFQYINRTKTLLAKSLLANWLELPLISRAAIESEASKIDLLSQKPEFMLRYLASASLTENDTDINARITQWMDSPLLKRQGWVYFLMRFIIPIITLVVTGFYALDIISFNAFTLYLFGPGLLVLSQIKRHTAEFNQAVSLEPAARSTAEMLKLVENSGLDNDEWNELFVNYDLSDCETGLKSLSKVVGAIESRNNVFVSIILNLFFMWDYHCAWRLNKWKQQYSEQLLHWMELAYTVEAYCSMGLFVFNHPDFSKAKISDDYTFQICDGIHFSLHKTGVPNSLELTREKFSIITGANMAGKSTYLRTVGTCLVLAMRGLPVPAREMVYHPAKIFTSMLSVDSLGDGQSYFFSELRRLRMLMDRLEAGEFHFVILDEILKGTNSVDKALGSKRFMEKVIKLPAKGLIATHDLSLCELANTHPGEIVNNKFEISYSGDELVFNYKLEPGVCENMNASFLLEKMGLT